MEAKSLRLELRASGDADRPVSANCSLIHITQGVAYLDFGFVEPEVFVQLSKRAEANEPFPDVIEGKLVMRVAISPQALLRLKEQTDEVLRKVGILSKE